MPSLDIATVQPSLQAYLVPFKVQSVIHAKTLSNPWKHSRFPKYLELYTGHLYVQRGKLLISAVATLETKSSVQKDTARDDSLLSACSNSSNVKNGNSDDDVEQVEERERLRRIRISKANKGNTPWNKGRKHSPETLQKIRERTKLAMQDPKIKLKLATLGHAQSEETRLKIGEGVKIGWERRKQRKRVQEKCHYEWQNLIAEASRRGLSNETEFQWNSYKIQDEQLQQEWLESIEQRKISRKAKSNRRAPKSLEQRKKIAEAIAAKWADPVYRERVYSGLSKYHGTVDGSRRKRSSDSGKPAKRNPTKKGTNFSEIEQRNKIRQRKRITTPVYKDPLAGSKLKMIKSIRAKRAADESKKIEAVERARLLIAEAEKAANALELVKTPAAEASLLESRKLIAEANLLIESIESTQITCDEDGIYSSENRHTEKQMPELGMDINGANPPFISEVTVQKSVYAKQLNNVEIDNGIEQGMVPRPNGTHAHLSESDRRTELPGNLIPNGTELQFGEEKVATLRPVAITKKWVRGRLVEVAGPA